jgi:hypothetical protein
MDSLHTWIMENDAVLPETVTYIHVFSRFQTLVESPYGEESIPTHNQVRRAKPTNWSQLAFREATAPMYSPSPLDPSGLFRNVWETSVDHHLPICENAQTVL